MDSLDLPEMEHDYSDVPDASEGLDEPARTSPAFGAGEDLSDIEMPVLSEMDGSAPVQPVKAEPQKQAPLQASVQTSAQISEWEAFLLWAEFLKWVLRQTIVLPQTA